MASDLRTSSWEYEYKDPHMNIDFQGPQMFAAVSDSLLHTQNERKW